MNNICPYDEALPMVDEAGVLRSTARVAIPMTLNIGGRTTTDCRFDILDIHCNEAQYHTNGNFDVQVARSCAFRSCTTE